MLPCDVFSGSRTPGLLHPLECCLCSAQCQVLHFFIEPQKATYRGETFFGAAKVKGKSATMNIPSRSHRQWQRPRLSMLKMQLHLIFENNPLGTVICPWLSESLRSMDFYFPFYNPGNRSRSQNEAQPCKSLLDFFTWQKDGFFVHR